MRASFNGAIPEIPGIAVDNFENTRKKAYFLSHCHADHTIGLFKLYDWMPTKNVSIYMSEPSAAIVESYVDKRLGRCIKPLPLGTSTITIPGEEDDDPEIYVSVTLIPAGHCFGSVMFLFETSLKRVLYTGDFRISENSVSKMAQLHENNKPIKLDVLYIDTTFQDSNHNTFPKRSEIIDYVVREIQRWLSLGEEYRVALEPSARYGYEYIFNSIYKRMDMKVYADSNWELYSKFLNLLPGVTNEGHTTKVHLCTRIKKYCNSCKNENHKFLYLHFSAMKWQHLTPDDLAIVTTSVNSRSVCFATHCSRSELIHFVEYLAPKKVVGFSEPFIPVSVPGIVTPGKRKSPMHVMVEQAPKKVPKHVLKKIFG